MNKLLKILGFINEYCQDLFFSLRYNTYSPFQERDHRFFYRILILTHTIEKGLSLPKTRPLYGKEKIRNLFFLINRYNGDFSAFPLQMFYGALKDYLRYHSSEGISDPFLDEIREFLENRIFEGIEPSGGVKAGVSFFDQDHKTKDFISFMESRSSCRFYEETVISKEMLFDVIRASQFAPSQCNRQSVRVHCYQDPETIGQLLRLQSGAAGMDNFVFNLFIVTSDGTAWGGFGQRNQSYVDGGLAGYGLMLSCHAHGLASCALNLAVGNSKERKIKAAAGIPFNERLIMMIAFGFPAKDLKAAASPRLAPDQILRTH